MKPKVFWFHYNKIASRKTGKPQISIHYNKTCYIVDNIDCRVPTIGKHNKRQPFFVMKGKCNTFILEKDNGKNVAVFI